MRTTVELITAAEQSVYGEDESLEDLIRVSIDGDSREESIQNCRDTYSPYLAFADIENFNLKHANEIDRRIDKILSNLPREKMEVVDIRENEKHLYTGAGLRIACFQGDQLVGLFDPFDQVPEKEDDDEHASEMVRAVWEWAISKPGDFRIVMASCYQLCDPVHFNPSEESDRAMLHQRLIEEIENFYI